MSSQRDNLVGVDDKRENRQIFEKAPTLLEFQKVLRIVIDRLVTYEVWPVGFHYSISVLPCT